MTASAIAATPPRGGATIARTLRQDARALRDQRRHLRATRQQEDTAWRMLRMQRRAAVAHPCCVPQPSPAADAPSVVQAIHWRALRAQRRATVAARAQADAQWRTARQNLRTALGQLPLITAWIAILVITDNCTRYCLGLPLFVAGSKVTAAAVVDALRALLPADLQFLISDRGVHFTAQVFQQLARDEQFIHVVIARHRPESNGIAERFVRTVKEWLADKVWTSDTALAALLHQFRAEYNDRPHQGIGIPGLSPNEFAERIWLL
ncbi:MAG: integrase core domain-containing protein [Roseiflexaceae bacterium]